MFPLIIARSKSLKNSFRATLANRWELAKVIGTCLFGLLLISCLYWWFGRVLVYLAAVPTIGALLTQKVLEMAFISAFSLIALSAMVTSLSTHFAASDLNLLFSFPLRSVDIFLMKSMEATIHASWMVTLVLFPFLLALAKAKALGLGFIVLASLLFIPFAFSASALGFLISSVFVSIFPRRKLSEFLSVLGVMIFVFLYTGVRLTLPQHLIHPERMQEVLGYVLYLQTPAAPLIPSRWYVGALSAYIAGDWPRVGHAVLILMGFALLALAVLLILGSRVVNFKRWSKVLEGSGSNFNPEAGEKPLTLKEEPQSQSLNKLLLIKELRFFLRDSQRFSNSSFIFAVVVIYLVSIYRLPMDTPAIQNFVSFINLALGLFIVAALSLRFCFPQISLELPYAWILRASPLSTRDFVKSKVIFNFIFLNILGLIMVIISPMLLGTDLILIPIYAVAACACASVFSFLSLALGSAFPKLRWENIIQIETSFGGFLYAACSLAFVGFTLAVFAWPMKFYFDAKYLNHKIVTSDWLWLGALAVFYFGVAFVVSWLSLRSVKRSWQRLET